MPFILHMPWRKPSGLLSLSDLQDEFSKTGLLASLSENLLLSRDARGHLDDDLFWDVAINTAKIKLRASISGSKILLCNHWIHDIIRIDPELRVTIMESLIYVLIQQNNMLGFIRRAKMLFPAFKAHPRDFQRI